MMPGAYAHMARTERVRVQWLVLSEQGRLSGRGQEA